MRFLDFFRTPDLNQGLTMYETTPGTVLLDVRTREEYQTGHIPGSKNIPLQALDKVTSILEDKTAPIFVHCLSGARSAQAVGKLKKMGYIHVTNIGGIAEYNGKVER